MKALGIVRSAGVLLLLLLFGLAQSARAELAAVGPIDPIDGFPSWYQDATGTTLELCLVGDGLTGPCIFDPVNPANPFSVQTNFGAEAFYWYADSTMLGAGAVDALLVMGLEAAYAAGDPAAGDQITFGRVRVRVSGLPMDGVYTIIYPYGSLEFNVVRDPLAARDINFTSDIGIGPFSGALRSAIGPFLRWAGPDVLNPAAPYVDPNGTYLGNPQVLHQVTGSPFGTNYFMIIGPQNAVLNPVNGSNILSTDLFTLAGKLATRASATIDRAAFQRDATGAGFVDVFVTSVPGQTIQATFAGALPVIMREEPLTGRYYARMAFDGTTIPLPAEVTVTNLGDIPLRPVTAPVTDTVWANNFYDTGTQSLLFTAISSDLGVPLPVISPVDAPPFLGPGVIAPPAFVTQRSAPGGGSDTEPVIVMAVNRAPQILSTAPTAAVVGEPYSYQVVAADDPGNTLTYGLSIFPAGMTISPAGLITWLPPTAPILPYTENVSLTVTDQGGLVATQAFTITVAANVAPQITSAPVIAAVGNQPYSYQVVATDANGGLLTYTLDLLAPAGMAISATGLITWTPLAVGDYPVTVTVTDPGGLSAAQPFSINVAGLNFAPTITSTPGPAGAPGAPYSYTLTATDTLGDVLTYSLDVAPVGMAISVAGVITFTPPTAGDYPVTARVTDQGGLFATQSFVLSVVLPNTAPVITATPPTVAQLNQLYQFQMTATDAPGSVLVWSLDAAPGGMTITPGGLISWTPTAPLGPTVTVRVTDQGGLFATLTFRITARDETLKITRAIWTGAQSSWSIAGTDNLPGNLITLRLDTAAGAVVATVSAQLDGTFSYTGPGLVPRGTGKKIVAVSSTGLTHTVSISIR